MTLNVGRAFLRSVDQFPDRIAAVDHAADVRYTYREWEQVIRAVAVGLKAHGIEPGDRVGIITRNRIEMGTLYWATQYIGAVFVPYNIRTSADELAFLIDNTQPELVVFSEATAQPALGAREEIGSAAGFVALDGVRHDGMSWERLSDFDGSTLAPTWVDVNQPSFILHTSGTTGVPKGVPRTHEETYTASHSHAIQVGWTDGESGLGVMPVFHTMGLHTLTTLNLLNGSWVVQRSFSPEEALDFIEVEGLTSLYLVPTIFHDLVTADALDDYDVSSVEKIAYAGMPMTENVQQQVLDVFDPDVFVNHYGSTEVFTYATCSHVVEKPGCAGRFGMNPRLRIVEATGSDATRRTEALPDGETGEIIVDASSPEVFDGYLNRPDADEAAFQDGWYFTGDLGYFDEASELFIVGRVDDMIISGGENIYPVEVENLLDDQASIDEVAVVGMSDDRWGQAVTAFVTVDETSGMDFDGWATELDMSLKQSDRLADFKRPRRYVFVDQLAMSKVGKILRRELQEEVADIEVYAEVEV